MIAAYIREHGGVDVLRVGELPDPVPGPGEVLVRVRFGALNHLDIWVRKGLPGLRLNYPHILGGDAAGVVESVGEGVTQYRGGEAVIVHPGISATPTAQWESLNEDYQILGEHISGTHAELVKVPVENVFPKPSNLSFEEAASVGLVFTTAWQMLVQRAQVKEGEVVLVHAAGSGVSTAAIQIVRLLGGKVIATAGSPKKLEWAKKQGAELTINYREKDFLKEIRQHYRKGVDVVVDHVGADLWEKNLKVLRSGGRLVTCGVTSGYQANTDLRQVFYRQLSILGSTMGSKEDFSVILEHLESGRLKATVDRTFTLSNYAQAHSLVESREILGKVLVQPGNS